MSNCNENRGSCRKYSSSCCPGRPAIIVQCQTPDIAPPGCPVELGQPLFALESGTFWYWGKKLVDTDNDGENDACVCAWLPATCGECAPIRFRQSQIFFVFNFTGEEPVQGPELDEDTPGVLPQVGDYAFDCANSNLWTYTQECVWELIGKCGGRAIITIDKSVSDMVFNCETMRIEFCYTVRVCNLGVCDFTSVSVTDNVLAQALAADFGQGEAGNVQIEFDAATVDAGFANVTDFAAGTSNVLVSGQALAAGACQTISYKISAANWCIPEGTCGVPIVNTATITEAIDVNDNDQAIGQSASAKAVFSGSLPSLSISKKFGLPRTNNDQKTVSTQVAICVSNNGDWPLTLNSLVDNVAQNLGSTAFSVSSLSVDWLCGDGDLPALNNGFNGNNSTQILNGTFVLPGGLSFQVLFDLTLQRSALSTISAEDPFCNVAELQFDDPLCRSRTCSAQDKFFCNDCPVLHVDQEVIFVRPKKERRNVVNPSRFHNRTRYEIQYEVQIKYTFSNLGCTALCNVRPYLDILNSLATNGVTNGQRPRLYSQQVTIVDQFPDSGPSVSRNGGFRGTSTNETSGSNRLIAQNSLDLLPGQGFSLCVDYCVIPPNNSQSESTDVAVPSCTAANVSGALPAVQGGAALLVQYETICNPSVIETNILTPVESHDCPAISLQKSTERLMDLGSLFTQTTDVFYQIDAYETPQNQDPQFLPTPPPSTHNCYQAVFKYTVTNTGNVPVDNIVICDNFFDQLQDLNGAQDTQFCSALSVKPVEVIAQTGGDGNGSFNGNGAWDGFADGDSRIGGGNALLLPGNYVEFRALVRFCIDPKTTIRIHNDATAFARGPNEALVQGESRAFIPIIGPSLCFEKRFAPGFPQEITPGVFRVKLEFFVYNDGDRRVLDVEIFDQYAEGAQTPTDFGPIGALEQGVRSLVQPCSTNTGESNANPAWDGSNDTTPVNTNKLPYLDRSESFTVQTPEFTVNLNNVPDTANDALLRSKTIYDDPTRNTEGTLGDTVAYENYNGVGSDIAVGDLCRTATLVPNYRNNIDNCPTSSAAQVSGPTTIDDTPFASVHTVTWQFPVTNSAGGSTVGIATIESLSVTRTTGLPGGVVSTGIAVVDPSPIGPGETGVLEWTETFVWTGVGNGPSIVNSDFTIATGNNQNITTDSCTFFANTFQLPFITPPPSPEPTPPSSP